MAQRSKSSVHRDIKDGKLAVHTRFPGYNGPVLVDERAARKFYAMAGKK